MDFKVFISLSPQLLYLYLYSQKATCLWLSNAKKQKNITLEHNKCKGLLRVAQNDVHHKVIWYQVLPAPPQADNA